MFGLKCNMVSNPFHTILFFHYFEFLFYCQFNLLNSLLSLKIWYIICSIYPFFIVWFMPKFFQNHLSRFTKYPFLKDDNLVNTGQWLEISYLLSKILCMNIVSRLHFLSKILQINALPKNQQIHTFTNKEINLIPTYFF